MFAAAASTRGSAASRVIRLEKLKVGFGMVALAPAVESVLDLTALLDFFGFDALREVCLPLLECFWLGCFSLICLWLTESEYLAKKIHDHAHTHTHTHTHTRG